MGVTGQGNKPAAQPLRNRAGKTVLFRSRQAWGFPLKPVGRRATLGQAKLRSGFCRTGQANSRERRSIRFSGAPPALNWTVDTDAAKAILSAKSSGMVVSDGSDGRGQGLPCASAEFGIDGAALSTSSDVIVQLQTRGADETEASQVARDRGNGW